MDGSTKSLDSSSDTKEVLNKGPELELDNNDMQIGVRKKYVMTDKRKLALENANAVRLENVRKRQEEKLLLQEELEQFKQYKEMIAKQKEIENPKSQISEESVMPNDAVPVQKESKEQPVIEKETVPPVFKVEKRKKSKTHKEPPPSPSSSEESEVDSEEEDSESETEEEMRLREEEERRRLKKLKRKEKERLSVKSSRGPKLVPRVREEKYVRVPLPPKRMIDYGSYNPFARPNQPYF